MHEDTFARRVKYAQRDTSHKDTLVQRVTFARTNFCTEGHYCTRVNKKNKKHYKKN